MSEHTFLSLPWFQEILPFLTFDPALLSTDTAMAQQSASFAPRLIHHGFVRLTPRKVWGEAVPEASLRLLSEGLAVLHALGLPLGLLSCCSEAQALARQLGQLLRGALPPGEGHACIGDWAFFHVGRGGKGWPPHRDRARVQGALLAPNGTPAYITCWMPLSSATPEASCLYFLPRNKDPGFEVGDGGEDSPDDEAGGSGGGGSGNPLTRAFSTPESFQNIIGLPTARGGLVCFSSRTLHWGGAPLQLEGEWEEEEGGPRPPRQALSIAFAVPSFEAPALQRSGACEAPTFAEAVVLACAQALIYHVQQPLAAEHARAMLGIVRASGRALLESTYFERARKAGEWAAFTTGFSSALGSKGGAAPSGGEVALAFAAMAGKEMGFDVSAYQP
jgi:hypothetical protein